ncbi:LEA type 2 family protein [Desulfolithobacter sp.]
MINLQQRYFSLVLGLLLLAGCAAVQSGLNTPKVSLADLKIEAVRPLETVFLVELRIMNPNTIPLSIAGITCDLEINGRHLASGISNDQIRIPAFGAATVPVTVYASMVDIFSSAFKALQGVNHSTSETKPLRYVLKGKVRLEESMNLSIPFSTAGEIPLTDTMPRP